MAAGENQLKVFNYNGDPYSTVIFLDDGKVIYLKYINDFVRRDGVGIFALSGWIWISSSAENPVYPVALISIDYGLRLANVPGSDQNARLSTAGRSSPTF